MTCLAPSDVVDFYKKNMENYSPRKYGKPPLLSSLKEISPPLLTMAFDDATNVDQKLTFALHVPTLGAMVEDKDEGMEAKREEVDDSRRCLLEGTLLPQATTQPKR